jgi:hypothetical protein
MKLVETKISETTVHMRYADNPDSATATAWIDFQVPLTELKHPQNRQNQLGDPELQYLAEVRLAALRYARDVVGGETQRLSGLAGRIA